MLASPSTGQLAAEGGAIAASSSSGLQTPEVLSSRILVAHHEPASPDFLSMPRSMFAHQELCDRITKSVAEITCAHGKREFLVPGIILEIEQGCYCILFECGIMQHFKTRSFELRFPNSSEIVRLSSMVLELIRSGIVANYVSLAAFSCNTAPNAYQPIELGQNVSMGQTLYLFYFRLGNPTVTKGTVNYADAIHFLLGAKPDHSCSFGALVFDEDCKLVGIVYDREGSLQSIQVNHIRKLLLDFFPGTKSMDDFFGKLNAAKDFVVYSDEEEVKRTPRKRTPKEEEVKRTPRKRTQGKTTPKGEEVKT